MMNYEHKKQSQQDLKCLDILALLIKTRGKPTSIP
jgi:hypothetical protein